MLCVLQEHFSNIALSVQDRRGTQTMDETDILKEELEHYQTERDRIRQIIGQIGGGTSLKRDRYINIVFLILVVLLFLADIFHVVDRLSVSWLPDNISIELALLLISLKILWMIHNNTKVYHFQFWVLNSIEFQINALKKQFQSFERREESKERDSIPPGD